MKLLFVGDWAPVAPRKEKVGDGFAIGNLECAFTDGEVTNDKAYSSVLPRSCMDNISSGGFAALSVANNHVNDAGNFRETYAELTRRFPSIQFFGTISKPYALIEQSEQSNNRAIVIGCLESCRSRGDFIFKQEDVTALIRKLRGTSSVHNRTIQQSNNPTILVYPHWGKEGEYTRYPAPWQLRLAREWINTGADGVLGSHSHVPQGREYYQGRPIYYSLGNFDFDHLEGKQYAGTEDRLMVEIDMNDNTRVDEQFSTEKAKELVELASAELVGWNMWNWAKEVGPFYLKKNEASWRIRLRKNFLMTFPKYLVWQLLTRTLFFRVASLWEKYQ